MNRPRTLISLGFFFMIIGFFMWGIGNSIGSDEHPYVRTAATGNTDSYKPNNWSYAHLWQNEVEAMGLDKWTLGEYGKSDKIRFEDVYVSTHSYGDDFASSGESITGYPGFNWLFDKIGLGVSGDLDWDNSRDTVTNISEGDHIYIYPHLNIDIPSAFFDLQQYIFVRTFDAYSGGNEWLHEPDTKSVDWAGGYCEWIPQLNCGYMGAYDLYYVIDVAYFNFDVISAIPGLNLLTDHEIETMIDEDKALFMERYGGIIYGDNPQDIPSMVEYHEVQYSSSGGLSTFFDVIHDIQMGWAAFTHTGNRVVDYGFTAFMGIMTLILSLTIYYEIKSYLPFISGGDGGE